MKDDCLQVSKIGNLKWSFSFQGGWQKVSCSRSLVVLDVLLMN